MELCKRDHLLQMSVALQEQFENIKMFEERFSYIIFEAPKVPVLAATQTLKIEKNFEHKSLSLKQQKIKINVFKSSKVAFKQKNLAWAI